MTFGPRDAILDKLQVLGRRTGYAVTKASIKGCYHLTDLKTDERAVAPNKTPAFTALEARRFLATLRDRNPP
jgi:hypothetical protein